MTPEDLEKIEAFINERRPTLPARFSEAKLADFPAPLVEDIARAMREEGNGLYIWGGVGAGKTHLAAAIFNRICDRESDLIRKISTPENGRYYFGKWPIFVSVPKLISNLRSEFNLPAGSDRRYSEFAEDLWSTDRTPFFDDIGAEKPSEWVEETLYQIVNERYASKRRSLFTSNLSPDGLAERVGERIASRIIGSCTIIGLDSPDRRKQSQESPSDGFQKSL